MSTYRHPIYSKDAAVYLVTGKTKFDALEEALKRAGFVEHLKKSFRPAESLGVSSLSPSSPTS